MGIDASVGAVGKFHAAFIGAGDRLHNLGTYFESLPGNGWRIGAFLRLLGDKLAGVDGGAIEGAVFFHQLDVRVIHEGTVLDGIYACNYGAPDGLGSMSVYSYFHAIVVSGFHDGADFILGHLWAGAVGAKVHDAARRHGFDEVSPFLIVQADYLPRFIGAIEYRLEGAGVALQIHAEPVGMILSLIHI